MSTSTSYINHGDHLLQLPTSISVEKVQGMIVSSYLKLIFYESSSDTTMPPQTAAGTRLLTSAKGKQPAKLSKAKASRSGADEGTGIILGVPDVPTDESDKEISWKSSDEDDDDDVDD
nr:hypothetical protein [Tanacetum cinerariifolium]